MVYLYLESCTSSFFNASATCTPVLPYYVADTSMSSHNTAALVRFCRLVLEMMILTLLGDADSMTTFIEACRMRTNSPSAPSLFSYYQHQWALSPRRSDVWALLMLGRSSTPSINCGSMARMLCVHRTFPRRPQAYETTCKSLVDVEQEKTQWETDHSALLLALWTLLLHCFIVSHSRLLDTLLGRCQRLFC